MLYMNDISYFIPSTCLSIEEVGKKLNLSSQQIKVYKKIYGLDKIPIATNTNLVEFLKKPVVQLIEKYPINLQQIKFIIHAHTAKVIAPFGESIIRQLSAELNLHHTTVFGMSINNCASAIAALEALSHLLEDNTYGIIICGEFAFTRVLQYIPNTSILGEAAIAVLLSKNGIKNKLLAIAMHTVGKFAKGIWLDPVEAIDFESCYVTYVANIIYEAIQRAGISLQQVKIIFPHNINKISWQRVAKYLNLSEQTIYLKNINKYSHCFGSDIFINYATAEQENYLQPGDYYLLVTVGLGAVFAAAVFQY